MLRFATFLAVVALAAGSVACVGIGGTTVDLAHGSLRPTDRPAQGALALVDQAEDRRDSQARIGRATVTLFAIPSGDVTTEKSLSLEVVEEVKAALETAGYEVTLTNRASASAPVLLVKIEEFAFKNYNWLWPLVPTWGSVELSLVVRRPDGSTAYEQRVEGSGNSFCLTGSCAFTSATKSAMTKVLDQIALAASSREFRVAVGLEGDTAKAPDAAPSP